MGHVVDCFVVHFGAEPRHRESQPGVSQMALPQKLNQGWGTPFLPRIQAVLITFKRSTNSRCIKGSMRLLALINVGSTFEVTGFFFSRACLVGQLLAHVWIKHVLPCVSVQWTHTKLYQLISICFFLIFLQLLQFQTALLWPSLASSTVSRATRRLQLPEHSTNNCDEDVACCVPDCDSFGKVIMSLACGCDCMTYKESLCLTVNNDMFKLWWHSAWVKQLPEWWNLVELDFSCKHHFFLQMAA